MFSGTRHSSPLWTTRLFKYHGEWPGNCIGQFPQDSGMQVIKSHILDCVHNCVHVVRNWIFCYSERNFPTSVAILLSLYWKDEGRESASEDWRRKKAWSMSAFSSPIVTGLSFLLTMGTCPLWLAFSGWHSYRSPCSSHPLPILTPPALWPS